MNEKKDDALSESAPIEKVSLAGLAGGDTSHIEVVSFSDLKGEWRGLHAPPTFQQLKGIELTKTALWFIFLLIVIFLSGWWLTRPTVADLQAVLGEAASGKDKLEALQSLRNEHLNTFRELFQLIIASVLVPIFTLLAGYGFGSREAEKTGQQQK